MHKFTNVLIALSFGLGLSACGGGYSGFTIPIETPLKPWVAPEVDELIEEEEEEEEYEEYEDEEDEAPAAPPVKS